MQVQETASDTRNHTEQQLMLVIKDTRQLLFDMAMECLACDVRGQQERLITANLRGGLLSLVADK